jgi:hypothetical protein
MWVPGMTMDFALTSHLGENLRDHTEVGQFRTARATNSTKVQQRRWKQRLQVALLSEGGAAFVPPPRQNRYLALGEPPVVKPWPRPSTGLGLM